MEEIDGIVEFLKKNKLVLISYLLIILIIAFLVYTNINPKKEKEVKETIEIEDEEKEEVKTFFVDIKGAVINPGTYEVLEGKRIKDVIELAGGIKENANTSINNLSLKVKDEMTIIIYTNEEVENFSKIKEEEKLQVDSCNNGTLKNDSCIEIDTNIKTSNLISINNATKEELMTLPGIGESKAKSIISYREENGKYKTIEDIKNVDGIGESLYAQIKDLITT